MTPVVLPPDSPHVQPFDFQLPHRLPDGAQDALRALFVSWARVLSAALTPRLATATTLVFDRVWQKTFGELLMEWTQPLVFVPINGTLPGVLVADIALAQAVTYRLLGGADAGQEAAAAPTTLSDFEQSLWTQEIVRVLTDGMARVWRPMLGLEQVWDALYLEPAVLSTRLQDADWMFVATFTWSLGGQEFPLSWVWSLADLSPLAAQAVIHSHPANSPARPSHRPEIGWQQRVRSVTVPVTVELGTVRLTVPEFFRLAVGQRFLLRTRITDQLPMRVGSVVKAWTAPASIDGRYAVQVAALPDERSLLDEDAGLFDTPRGRHAESEGW